MNKKSTKNMLKIEETIKSFIYIYFVISCVLMFDLREFIAPKLGVPLISTSQFSDIFNFWKIKFGIIIILICLALYLYLISNQRKYSFTFSDYLVCMVIVFSLISTALSDYTSISLWGTYERPQGMIFFLMLITIYYISSKLEYNEKDIKKIDLLSLLFLGINFFYVSLHYLGVDILKKQFFQKLIFVPEDFLNKLDGYIFSTVENQNYLSFFSAFLLIFFLTRFIFDKERKNFLMFHIFLSLYLLFLSSSLSGYMSLIVVLPIFIYYLFSQRKVIVLHKDRFILLIIMSISLFLLLFKLVPTALSEIFLVVKTLENYIIFYLAFCALVFSFLFLLKNKQYKTYLYLKIFGVMTIFAIVIFFIVFFPYSDNFGEHNPKKIYTRDFIEESIEEVSNTKYQYSSLSGREYIWRDTMDLIKEKPFWGYGLSTMVLEYPNQSIVKFKYLSPNLVVTKPHNLYLEIWYGSGAFVLVSFLAIFLLLIINTVYFLNNKFDFINFSILLSLITFIGQGFVNDMEVATYPIVFLFLGILSSRIEKLKSV